MEAKILLDNMWQDYLSLNPLAKRIFDLFIEQGEEVINDHIALRTFEGDKTGINIIARQFLESGYEFKDEYHFEKKKLYARHLEHKNPDLPKVFISELKVRELSENTQDKIKKFIDEIDSTFTSKDNFLYSGRPWNLSYSDYEQLLNESEYAAWMSAFGFRPNHFTVSVNRLKNFKTVEDVNKFLKQHKISLNTSGGEIKGGPEEFLAQSSTLANSVKVKFSDQEAEIPSCYYEFALRYPMDNGDLYNGFVAKSADKIFESTDRQS